MSSTLIIALMQLVEAGFELRAIALKAQQMELAGASSDEIAKWLVSERDKALKALRDAPETD